MALEFDLEGATAVVARLESGEAVVQAQAVVVMGRIARRLHKVVHDDKLSGQALGVRTGTTRRALYQRVLVSNDEVLAVVGVDVKKAPGARANEFGATIRPTSGEYLTVPIGAALTPKGVTKFDARTLWNSPSSVGYVGSFVAKEIIFGKKADGSIEPLFALKRQVVLKPTGYLASARNEMHAWLPEETARLVNATVRVLDGGHGRG